MQPQIELSQVAIGYGRSILVDNINLNVQRGDFLGIIGPNGAGKSTLLKTITGILKPLGGILKKQPDIKMGYVPQQSSLDDIFPLTVMDIVKQGSIQFKWGCYVTAKTNVALSVLKQLEIESIANKRFRDLSGGQQQRVLIARALIVEPNILILDEPTAGLDSRSEKQLLDILKSLNETQHITIVIVVHRLSQIRALAKHIAFIDKSFPIFEHAKCKDMLNKEALTKLYKYPVVTTEFNENFDW